MARIGETDGAPSPASEVTRDLGGVVATDRRAIGRVEPDPAPSDGDEPASA